MRRKMENKNSGGLAVGEAGLRTTRDSGSPFGSTGLDYLRGSVSTLRRLHLNASRVHREPVLTGLHRIYVVFAYLHVSFSASVFYARTDDESLPPSQRFHVSVFTCHRPCLRLPVSPNMRLSPSVARVVFVSSRVPVSVSPPQSHFPQRVCRSTRPLSYPRPNLPQRINASTCLPLPAVIRLSAPRRAKCLHECARLPASPSSPTPTPRSQP